LEKFLNKAGYAFDSCSTGHEALELARKVHPDVVILEYHLPDANGAALLKQLKLNDPLISPIVLSEYDFQAVVQDLGYMHPGWFLKKPFNLADIELALSSACSTKARRPAKDSTWQPDSN
jgi:DNA-binding NtrC family response regulator